MSIENRLASLRSKHDELDREIARLEAAPSVDHLEITALKKRKLALKEEIENLAAEDA